MKSLALFLLLGVTTAFAEQVTLSRSAVLKAERAMMTLKPGTVVEVVSRTDKVITVRHNKLVGTIPAASVDPLPAAAAAPAPATPPAAATAPAKKAEPTPMPVPPRQATTNYGKMVEKAKENAGKHDNNVVQPANEVLR